MFKFIVYQCNISPALHQDAFGLFALVGNVLIPSQFAIHGDTQEIGRRLHLYYVVVNFQRYGKLPFPLPGEHNRVSFQGTYSQTILFAPFVYGIEAFLHDFP